ncbi:MAG TPA: flagellar hook-basal body complex protein FliE [Rhodopila sp.]|jgi:flagellar hook-basal body complex protein FliE|nr:flagellar hook-basal body complex protein FliE [Rhodopila sp.]
MISSNVTGAAAYAAIQDGFSTGGDDASAAGDTSFGAVLQGAVTGLTDLGQAADAKSVQAMSGQGNMTDMVMAVSKAEMALDASVAVRDKVISAYQEIMRMSV